MAEFACVDCSHEAHFSEFKTGTTDGYNDDGTDFIEEDEVECPRCGSDAVYEL